MLHGHAAPTALLQQRLADVVAACPKAETNVVQFVGHSILNRTSNTDVGKLMLAYGGGGHQRVGTCQVTTETAERNRQELIDRITSEG